MLVKCKTCQNKFDVPEKYFEYAAEFAALYNTVADFFCETCSRHMVCTATDADGAPISPEGEC